MFFMVMSMVSFVVMSMVSFMVMSMVSFMVMSMVSFVMTTVVLEFDTVPKARCLVCDVYVEFIEAYP